MKINTDLLHRWEGCELTAYKPLPHDKWTIGWGNTYYEDGSEVEEGDTITQARADKLFQNVLEKDFVPRVKDLVKNKEFHDTRRMSALVCLCYNIGISAFSNSTVLRRINANESQEDIAEAWKWWHQSGGEVVNGLRRRRASEIDYCFSEED